MKILTYTGRDAFAANCYIIISDSGNAAIIDAPCGYKNILKLIEENGGRLSKILLTHGHCDHIESLYPLAEKTGADVYIHTLDERKLHDDHFNLSEYFNLTDYFGDYYNTVSHFENAHTVENGDSIVMDEIEFKVLHTPGHTSGSVCYLAGDIMFSGDTIFASSIGRTDMPDGNPAIMQQTINMLKGIEQDFTILSGHGGPTKLSVEKIRNPYLRGNFYDDMF
ncbi:MAG: MBL fold metallo-hydrolase [Oscillospiraceae bacterium]|nr:MBL fold metallo-hydrolase [Oscillospiraceae bacterium]